MRPRFAIALLIANTAWAQGPVEIPFAEVHEHILRSPGIIHSVVTLDRLQPDYVTLQIVVDEAGRVESAKAVAGPKDFFSQAESLESQRHFKPFERNGQPVRAAFEDYVSIMPPESWSDKKVPFPEIKDWSSLKISLERTACYGSCPDYSIEVLGNGNVEFRGNRHVLITGNHRATISQQAIRDLFSVFKAADYFSLKDKYSYAVTDNPTFKTAIEFDGFKKSVVDYVGAHVGMPDVVTDLEMAVDRLAGSEKWVKGNQETGPALIAERWDFRANTEENRTLFSNVVARGTPDLVQLFVSNGTPALGMDKNGAGPLMNAARKGDFDLVKTILHGQGDPPAAAMSCTLGAAAHSGNLPLVQFLIEKGAPGTCE